MKSTILTIIFLFISTLSNSQVVLKSYLKDFNLKESVTKHLKFSTVYAAVNGGTSVSGLVMKIKPKRFMMEQNLITVMRLL